MTHVARTPDRQVYIVEDEPQVRESLTLLLSTAGITTEEYASAEGFLESAATDAPFCVILDNRLPGMSGLEMLKRLDAGRGHASVIMMTGHGDIPTAVAAMKLGAFHFVEKPFDPESLLTVVDEALSRTERNQDRAAEAARFRERRAQLTEREAEVFACLTQGLPTKTIAARLDITVRTAEHHRAAVMRKLEAKSISHLLKMALAVNDVVTTNSAPAR